MSRRQITRDVLVDYGGNLWSGSKVECHFIRLGNRYATPPRSAVAGASESTDKEANMSNLQTTIAA